MDRLTLIILIMRGPGRGRRNETIRANSPVAYDRAGLRK